MLGEWIIGELAEDHLGETNASGVGKMDIGKCSVLECIGFATHAAGKGI